MVAALKIFLGMEDICIKGLLKRLGHDYFFKKKKLILGFVRVLVTNIFHGKKTGNIGKMLWGRSCGKPDILHENDGIRQCLRS